jgi:hypothetical protein
MANTKNNNQDQEITFEILEVPSVERSGRTSEGKVLAYVGKNRSGSFGFATNKEFQTWIGNRYNEFFLGRFGKELYLVAKNESYTEPVKRISLSPVPEIEGKKLVLIPTDTPIPEGFKAIWYAKIEDKNSKA